MADVFIGIPTINRPEFVREAITSALAQSYRDIEVVVSDNGSESGVAEQILAFIQSLGDDRVRFHQQPENLGEYGQGRYLLAESAGSRYFMILHDDDLLHANYVGTAVACLDRHEDLSLFMADARIIDVESRRSPGEERKFLADHGRDRTEQGPFDVLDRHMDCGFTLISGTLFRRSALTASGFANPEGIGNYPFESDVLLRLGDQGARGWYQRESLLSYRFHDTSMRHYIKLLDNQKSVDAMIRLFECRNFTGYAERRRRDNLGCLYRAKSLIAVRLGRHTEARTYMRRSFNYNILSIKNWIVAPVVLIMPGVFGRLLPALPIAREAPGLRREPE